MTHAELVERAARWLKGTARCSVVITEQWSMEREIPDAIGWRSHESYLVECKTSRADFLHDLKKWHRKYPDWGMGELRYYMTPPGLIQVDELPDKWGLLEVYPKIIRKVRYASRFDRQKAAVKERTLMYQVIKDLMQLSKDP